jgi:hypothetical protein
VGHRAFAVLVTILVLGFAFADAIGAQDDAGSGTDAGNAPESALKVTPFAPYEGNLTETDATDWYAWKAGSKDPYCAQLNATSTSVASARLVVVDADSITREAVQTLLPTRTTVIGIATPDGSGGLLNVTDAGLAPLSAVDYHFQTSRLKAAQITSDAGSGTDAPATAVGALAVTDACFGGRLDGASDTVDTFLVAGDAGDPVVLSLSDTSGHAVGRLSSPTGDVLATIASGGITQVTLPSTGSYALTISNVAAGTYLVGVCDPCEPPESPCRPMCAIEVTGDQG